MSALAPALPVAPANPSSTAPAAPVIPFTRASSEWTEPIALDQSRLIGAAGFDLGPVPVPAYGYLRGIWLQVEATGGTGAAAVFNADGPFSIIDSVSFQDTNGASLVGPLTGFELYLVDKYGGYHFDSEPKNQPDYSATTAGNFNFWLYIPVEIANRDALGALPNMNSSSTYQLRVALAAQTAVYTTNPTTAATVRVRAYADAWAPPSALAAGGGGIQAMMPPALQTTQFWARTRHVILAGNNRPRLTRVGNLIRNLILVNRNAAGARVATDFPASLRMTWDGTTLWDRSSSMMRALTRQRFGFAPDVGVYPLTYTHDFDGHPGGEMRDLWLRTAQSSRIEFEGSFVSAGSLEVLTNDVAPVGDPYLS